MCTQVFLRFALMLNPLINQPNPVQSTNQCKPVLQPNNQTESMDGQFFEMVHLNVHIWQYKKNLDMLETNPVAYKDYNADQPSQPSQPNQPNQPPTTSCSLVKSTTRQVVCRFVTDLALCVLNLGLTVVGGACFACLVALLYDYTLNKVCPDEVCPHKGVVQLFFSYASFVIAFVLLAYCESCWAFVQRCTSSSATSSSKQVKVHDS
jgi:hypothetical protein